MTCTHESIRSEKLYKLDSFEFNLRHYCLDCGEERTSPLTFEEVVDDVVTSELSKSDYKQIGKQLCKSLIEFSPFDRIALWNLYIADHYPSYVSAEFKLDKELLKN